eukprot:6486634-Amphidinium_carterae.2
MAHEHNLVQNKGFNHNCHPSSRNISFAIALIHGRPHQPQQPTAARAAATAAAGGGAWITSCTQSSKRL